MSLLNSLSNWAVLSLLAPQTIATATTTTTPTPVAAQVYAGLARMIVNLGAITGTVTAELFTCATSGGTYTAIASSLVTNSGTTAQVLVADVDLTYNLGFLEVQVVTTGGTVSVPVSVVLLPRNVQA